MELLRHVQADWSEDVEELVQTCLGIDHPNKSEAYWTWGCLYKIKIQAEFIAPESILD